MKKRIIAIICAGMLACGMSACGTTDGDVAADGSLSQEQEEAKADMAHKQAEERAALSELIKNNALAQVQNAANAQQAGLEAKKVKDEEAARLKEQEAKKAEEARKQEEADERFRKWWFWSGRFSGKGFLCQCGKSVSELFVAVCRSCGNHFRGSCNV